MLSRARNCQVVICQLTQSCMLKRRARASTQERTKPQDPIQTLGEFSANRRGLSDVPNTRGLKMAG